MAAAGVRQTMSIPARSLMRRQFMRAAGSASKANLAPAASKANLAPAMQQTNGGEADNFDPGCFADVRYTYFSRTAGAPGFPNVNARYQPDFYQLTTELPEPAPARGASENHWHEEWPQETIQEAVEDHVLQTWVASDAVRGLPHIVRSEGCYLIDSTGKRYLDWTSQAVCSNLGHDVPPAVVDAVTKQLQDCSYIYGGMGIVPVRARLSRLMAELMPGDITGFLFPSGGGEANEAAIRIARRYTGKNKILTQYRSYHGGTAQSLSATGDFRRWFTESGVNGFVKIFNPQPMGFSWGPSDEEATARALQALEEQILLEGPQTIAAVMLESIVGAGGVLVPPAGYMEGVRALCDKYEILLILDEVMAGFGRTGELWAFQHFDNVLPDIVTSAKGLTGAHLPLSMVAVRQPIKDYFMVNAVGWGATYHAHPVAMAAAYECVKYTVEQKLPQKAKKMQRVMMEEINGLVDNHISVKQGRAIGLFGCLDLCKADGQSKLQTLGQASPEWLTPFRKAMPANGLMGLLRIPLLHCCPPLVITEPELRDGFRRLSKALDVLDDLVVKNT